MMYALDNIKKYNKNITLVVSLYLLDNDYKKLLTKIICITNKA